MTAIWIASMLLFYSSAIYGQTVSHWTLTPNEQDTIGQFQRYGLRGCNISPVAANLTVAQFHAEVLRHRITPATNAELLQAGNQKDDLSWQRKTLLAIEISSYLLTAVTTTDLIKINERWVKGLTGTLGPGLRVATTMIKLPKFELPTNGPKPVLLPSGECVEFSIYGVRH